MTGKLPRPLIHKTADVRHFAFMPLDVGRLRDSRLSATATDGEFRAAVLLWCAAWHQVPAGSLPDDDRELAVLALCGRDADAFRPLREGALHGFVKCADGRLYHPVICDKAKEALGRSEAGKKGAKSRWQNKKSGNATAERPQSDRDPSAMQGTGTGTGTERKDGPNGPSKTKPATGSRLSEDWWPSETDWQFARREGLTDEEITREAHQFRDFWHAKPGQGGRKVDWPATWRTWIRRTAGDRKRTPARQPSQGHRQGPGSAVAAYSDLVSGSGH